jgi:hypothetical protein
MAADTSQARDEAAERVGVGCQRTSARNQRILVIISIHHWRPFVKREAGELRRTRHESKWNAVGVVGPIPSVRPGAPGRHRALEFNSFGVVKKAYLLPAAAMLVSREWYATTCVKDLPTQRVGRFDSPAVEIPSSEPPPELFASSVTFG